MLFPDRDHVGVGAPEGVLFRLVPIHPLGRDGVRADLHDRAADADAGDDLARDGAGRDPGRGLARRLPTAAAIIPHAVLGEIGVVGVAGPEGRGDLGIVAAALVDVLDHQRDRRAGGHLAAELFLGALVREHAGEDLHRVRLLPLGDELALAGAALLQPLLDVGLGQRDLGRAAIDHAAQRRPVAFAPGRHAEQVAEGVVRHGGACSGTTAPLQIPEPLRWPSRG